jgi:hypothetical protein
LVFDYEFVPHSSYPKNGRQFTLKDLPKLTDQVKGKYLCELQNRSFLKPGVPASESLHLHLKGFSSGGASQLPLDAGPDSKDGGRLDSIHMPMPNATGFAELGFALDHLSDLYFSK